MEIVPVKFPLPDEYFPPVRLTPEQIQGYEQQVEIIVKNALAELNLHEAMGAHPNYGSRWETVGTAEHLTAIRELDPTRNVDSCRVYGRVDGSYRNAVDFYYSVTSQQLFAVNQIMFGYVVDAAVLCNIHTKESGKPHQYMGIKWLCLQPNPLARKRDSCFLEYLVYTKDLQSRDVGVRVMLPMNLPECPPLPEKMKSKRSIIHSVVISRAAGDNTNASYLFMTIESDMVNGAADGVPLKKLMTTLSSMALYSDSKRILMHGLAKRSSWVDKHLRKNCPVCNRKFHATRRRQHCRLCGDVACRRCMTVRDAPQVDDSATVPPRTFQVVKTLFCKVCMSKMHDVNNGSLISNSLSFVSQDEAQLSENEGSGWFLGRSGGKMHEGNRYSLTDTGGSSVVSLDTPSDKSVASLGTPQSKIEEEDVLESELGSSKPTVQPATDSAEQQEQVATKTSVSSDEEDDYRAEPPAVMIDLRHLRTMAGAERVVAEAEAEEQRAMRETLASVETGDTRSAWKVVEVDDDAPAFTTDIGLNLTRLGDDDVQTVESQPDLEFRMESSAPVAPMVAKPREHQEQSPTASARANQMYANSAIDQRLAEQEELLQQLVMAANSSGFYPASSGNSHVMTTAAAEGKITSIDDVD